MGIYVNPGNIAFREAVNSIIYVDKSGIISYTNSVLNTKQKFICVSRPRRFGKSHGGRYAFCILQPGLQLRGTVLWTGGRSR